MALTDFLTAPHVGANPHLRRKEAEFDKGTIGYGTNNTRWIYVEATEAVSGTCTVNLTTFNLTDAAGNHTADAAFASGDFGWVRSTAGPHT